MILKNLFRRKKTIFSKTDQALWNAAKKALSDAGITDFKAGKYLQSAGGCG